MSEFYENIEKLILKKNPILISNIDNMVEDEYVLDFFLKKNKNIINFTFSKYLDEYGDAVDLYDIYDHCEFNCLNDFFKYFGENYKVYEAVLNGILKKDYSRFLK
ncbi:hypothetical protein AC056_15695 [Acinetobacter genomosp. 33YU]|uniref:hypothetical protein n=1 Tax=Acinetobacter genomosp. 33YU TaxID=1675530 RepID=UPI00097F93BE|nr:hypothetical protein [Acinetobacter genomosp. 33YU]ONN48934.1 hypothetical protein AC056_15695 [Acinetobacter genomosp. 33YU]